MSFFSAAFSLKKIERTVTPADLLNAIVIPLFECKFFVCYMETDALWNGEVACESQQNNGAFFINFDIINPNNLAFADNIRFAASQGAADFTHLNAFSGSFATNQKFPFLYRFRVGTHPTNGTCKIKVFYLD